MTPLRSLIKKKPMSLLETLKMIKKLLSDKARWTKGTRFRIGRKDVETDDNEHLADRCCLIGACESSKIVLVFRENVGFRWPV